jgi:cobalt-zinc-cadmium efflux system outer membrane protein
MAAHGQLISARAWPNPTLTTTYSKDAPQYHILGDIPLDFGSIRAARVRSAESSREAAVLRYQFARAAIVFDADTTYTRALAALARAQLSRRNAADADSLRRIAELRRDAGDASELEVQLATVNAGQQANLAVADSLALIATLLDLQTVVGLPSDQVALALSDSLGPPPNDVSPARAGMPLLIAAAEASLTAAEYSLRLQRRSIWSWPSLEGGVETRDPSGDQRGLLPTVGVAIPLPLLNRNRGPILSASADRERARAEVALARLESRGRILRSLRERDVALGKIARDQRLLESGNRVVAMSIRAYQEGAAPLANVLEAQRTAREVLGQYIDDLAAAWIAISAVRLFTLTASSPP